MIETVTYPELSIIGVMVDADLTEDEAVAAAWERLFAVDTGATAFVQLSLPGENGPTNDGSRRELVGFIAAKATAIPAGMIRVDLDPGRYLRLRHEGTVSEIAAGFARLRSHAEAAGLRLSGIRLDFGHSPGLPAGPHDLHLGLATQLPAVRDAGSIPAPRND